MILSFFLLIHFSRDQSLTDIMPLYKTMKKATFPDSSDEVCSSIYAGVFHTSGSFLNFSFFLVTIYIVDYKRVN